jgi:NADH-quinone oxidoreductase subunit K
MSLYFIYYFWFSFTISLFCLGLFGALFNHNTFLHTLLNIEVMLFGVTLTYIGFSVILSDTAGQLYALFIIVVAAAESCAGLSLLLSFLRIKNNTDLFKLKKLD